MKRIKKININDDERWNIYNELKKKGDIIKADKLKEEILNSGKYKKPCHHVSEIKK
jgi:hypothetical protein